jgi:3-deoxy-manno-octulosonate cytidylyltransferase (CMP-KDO synthetase)
VHPSGRPQITDTAGTPSLLGSIVGAIPARFGSSRLPGKPLLPIAGRPMIEHVYARASEARGLDRVVVLTDDERIARAVEAFGGRWEMTPADCASGTDRIAWAARSGGALAEAAAVVNIQGDEPLIDPAAVSRLALHLRETPADPVVTLAAAALPEELGNPNAVKVVTSLAGYALYFSRSPIPYPRHPSEDAGFRPLKHLGIYGYQREALLRLAALPPSPLERSESLEQLRALENGIAIRVLLTERASPGVDTREDLDRVERLLAGTSNSFSNTAT